MPWWVLGERNGARSGLIIMRAVCILFRVFFLSMSAQWRSQGVLRGLEHLPLPWTQEAYVSIYRLIPTYLGLGKDITGILVCNGKP